MNSTNFLKIMSPVIEASIEMKKSKNEWIEKIRGLRDQLTENGTDVLIFSEALPDGAEGYFYRDLSLAQESVGSPYGGGTPIWIEDISCFLHTKVNYSKDGEFYPQTYIYLALTFFCQSNSSYVKEHFPGKIIWRTDLFSTYLEWSSESKHKGDGIGFACKDPIYISRFSEPGWTIIFEDDNLRKSVVKKLEDVASCLRSLIPKDANAPLLLFKPEVAASKV